MLVPTCSLSPTIAVVQAADELIGEQLERPHIAKNPTRPSARRINSIDSLFDQ
jgi:hypothetical protein